MKKSHIVIIIVLIVVLVILGSLLPKKKTAIQQQEQNPAPAQTQSTGVQIIFPTKTDPLVAGKTYTLKWMGGQNPIDIFLIDDALKSVGVSVSLVDRVYHIQNTGSYDYTVPTYLKPGMYQFEIGTATSDSFQIMAK